MFYVAHNSIFAFFFLMRNFSSCLISVSCNTFLCSYIPWIIIFDVNVCLFWCEMFSSAYLVVPNGGVSPGCHNSNCCRIFLTIGWRERNQQDATNLMFIIKLLSQHVSGIIMPIIRRTRVCTAAYGVLHCNKRGGGELLLCLGTSRGRNTGFTPLPS